MTVTPGSLGIDYSYASPTRALLGQLGVTFACRYLLDPARDQGKALSRLEAQTLGSWGVPVVSNFEYAAGGALLGYAQGVLDAVTSRSEIADVGATRSVVYFSADVDLSISQIPAVLDYANGAASVLGRANVGLYGEYDLIEAAGRAGFHWLWQTYAWSRGLWSRYATIRQVQNEFIPGYDKDIAFATDIGQWFPTGYGEIDMNLSDRIVVGDRYKNFPPELNVTAKTEFTVEEALLQGMYRPAQAVSMIRAADMGDQARDAAESQQIASQSQAIANLAAAVHAGAGQIDTQALGEQLLAVLAPAQAIALSDVLRKTHLTVDGS